MSIFKKAATLVTLWQKIKTDAEKARGGKKPGGKMGFEPLIKTLEAAMKSNTPDLGKVKAGTAALRIELNKYKLTLDAVAEKGFIADITGFVKLITEMEGAAEAAMKDGAQVSQELAAVKTNFVRLNTIVSGFAKELDAAIKELSDRVKNDQRVNIGHLETAYERAKKASDAIQKVQPEYSKLFSKIRTLDNRAS
jgi:hypothetical protein